MAESSATASLTPADQALKRSGELTNVVVPYRYDEFPRVLYKAGGLTLMVDTVAQKDAATAAGWAVAPVTEDSSPSKKGK